MTELASSLEFAPALTWYQETVKMLPEMRVNVTPLKDTKESTVNPSFFSYANVDVTTEKGSWQQGGIIQRSESLPDSAPGMTLLLTDPKGNIFITVSQEPLAKPVYVNGKEIHPIVRSPLQTSSEKFKQGKDPVMTSILTSIAKEKGKSIQDILEHLPLSQAPTDGNRMQSNVAYGEISVSTQTASDIAHKVRHGRWVSPKELDTLVINGVTNGNLNIARTVVEAQRRQASTS